MKGYLWVVNEAGLVTKIYFDKEKNIVKKVKERREDYSSAFKIAAWILQLSKRRPMSVGEVGYAKENIIYAMKGSLIIVLVADRKINNSPYIYGFLRTILERIRANTDGVILVDLVERDLKNMLRLLPRPLETAKPKYEIDI